MKGVLPWLAPWASHAGTRDFLTALAALLGPAQNIFSPTLCPLRPASSAGCRAGSPVLLICVSGA